MPRIDTSASKLLDLAAERVALGAHVHDQPEVLAVEHDQPRAGAEHGHPPPRRRAAQLAQRLGQALALDP